ncbi:MAG TPA: glycosyltransferase [Candidatus Thermoplasmatota archaeon]|nr:glycosyltransferase [Candidatus Thermoplasmatota archaeon]
MTQPSAAGTFPLVTVAVPLHNHAKYLRACLDSVAAEDYPELELLVVDDGSTDASLRLAEQWVAENGHRFRRCEVRSQPNRGICATLNRLVRESQGEFIVPLASDDRLLPGGIAPRVRLLQEAPASLAVLANTRVIDAAGNVLADDGLFRFFRLNRRYVKDPRSRAAELLLNWSLAGPVLLVRRSAYLEPGGIGLYDEAMAFEDRDFFLRVLARPDGLLFHDAPVAEYRVHGGNHVGPHVVDRARAARVDADYAAMAHKNAPLYRGALRLAIRMDAWDRAPAPTPLRKLWRRVASEPARRLKVAVLASRRRTARRRGP